MSIIIKEFQNDKGSLYYQLVNEEEYDKSVKLLSKEEVDAVYSYEERIRAEKYVKSMIEIMCDSGALTDEEEYLLTKDDEIVDMIVTELIDNDDSYQKQVMQLIQRELDERLNGREY